MLSWVIWWVVSVFSMCWNLFLDWDFCDICEEIDGVGVCVWMVICLFIWLNSGVGECF